MKKDQPRKHNLKVEVDLQKAEKSHLVSTLSNCFFPYEPYPQQIQIIGAIQQAILNSQNVLLESPTGTGKTLCLLVGALSSLVDTTQRKKVFYLTRTHSQISQVVSQFKKTVYSCNMNIIASREQLCINPNLSKLKGKLLNKACDDLCFQKLCTYKELVTAKRPKEPLDLPEFKQFCKKELTCPYFYSKQLTEKCQLTILPFNYLLDWNLFEKTSIDIKDSVIIFDEAHNIDTLCQQGSDIKLSADLLIQTVTELKTLVKAVNSKTLHPQFKQKYQDRQQTVDFKSQIELLLNRMKSVSQSQIISRQDLLQKLQQFTTTSKQEGTDLGNYRELVSRGRKIVKMSYKKEIQCQNLQLFLTVFENIYGILQCQEQFEKFAITFSKTELLFRCLDPSLCFSRIAQCKPKSIILSSGTLGDLNMWQGNLKLKFPHKIVGESFITDQHLYAQIRPKSENGVPFNFSFQGKQNQQQFSEIGKELKKLQNIITGGIIVAFSTYELLEKAMKYCSHLQKKVYFQTKGGSIDEVYSQYKAEIQNGTAFLFIVIKGRFSEGINFTGELCRCLVVIGIPFLPLKDPGVVEKMKYLQNKCTKGQGDQWYTMQSFKGLNQTLGRAIRNKQDYAVILLLDQRYTKEEYINNLSKWFSRCLKPIKNDYQQIKEFVKNALVNASQRTSQTRTSTNNKKEPTICQRLAEFSTPNKSNKFKKVKLVLEVDQVSEVTDNSPKHLKQIKIVQQPYYQSMKKQLQDYFINFRDVENEQNDDMIGTLIDANEREEESPIETNPSKNMIQIMRSFGKYNQSIEF